MPFFTVALQLKADLVLTNFRYAFVLHPPGTLSSGSRDGGNKKQWLDALLRVYTAKASKQTGRIDDALVRSKNFLTPPELDGEVLFTKEVAIENESSEREQESQGLVIEESSSL